MRARCKGMRYRVLDESKGKGLRYRVMDESKGKGR